MAQLGNTLVNGVLRVLGDASVNTINGVAVGSSPKFTDTNTWNANTVNTAGYVSAPTTSNANKVWKTDASGNPGWRDDAGISTLSDFIKISGTALIIG